MGRSMMFCHRWVWHFSCCHILILVYFNCLGPIDYNSTRMWLNIPTNPQSSKITYNQNDKCSRLQIIKFFLPSIRASRSFIIRLFILQTVSDFLVQSIAFLMQRLKIHEFQESLGNILKPFEIYNCCVWFYVSAPVPVEIWTLVILIMRVTEIAVRLMANEIVVGDEFVHEIVH